MLNRVKEGRPGDSRVLAGLFLASLVLRLALAAWVISADMPVRGDEGGYVRRAVAASLALDQLAEGEPLTLADVDRWYGGGRWGPLYPLVLAIGFQFSDEHVATARLLVAFVGALTTPLVFVLARRIGGGRAAWFAAHLHLFYGGFLAFSHLLWSETFFLFPLLASVHLANRLDPEASRGSNLRTALGSGFSMGVAGLIRPTILPFLALFPVWMLFRMGRKRGQFTAPALFLAASLTTLAPWSAWQYAVEGHFVPLATTGSLNLFRANKPPGMTEATVAAYARAEGKDLDCVMQELALGEMKKDPVGILSKGLARSLRDLWSPERLTVSLMRRGFYPPLPYSWAAVSLLFTLAVYLAIVLLGGAGFRLQITKPGSAGTLLLLMVLSSLLFPIIMRGGNSRLVLVNLALMLPMAGYGLAHRHKWKSLRFRLPSTLLIFAMPISILSTLAGGTGPTTGYYAELVSRWHGALGIPTRVFDELEFRGAFLQREDRIEISTGENYWILETGTASLHWELTPTAQTRIVTVVSLGADTAPVLGLASKNFERRVPLQPVHRDTWQTWQPTGLPGIDVRWKPTHQKLIIPTPGAASNPTFEGASEPISVDGCAVAS